MLALLDAGERLEFGIEDLMRYHGPGSPGGVAIAYKALERALSLLAPVQRRDLTIRTAFGGPGARDGFELVTRAVTGGRYTVDLALARPELGFARERFVFVLAHAGQEISLAIRPAFVTDAFVALARTESRSAEQEDELTRLKSELADRVLAAPAEAVFDVASRR